MAGVPHFDDAIFVGRFPVAEIEFIRDAFPGKVSDDGVQPIHPAQRPRHVDARGHVLVCDRERYRRADRLHGRSDARKLWLRQRRARLLPIGAAQRAALHLRRRRPAGMAARRSRAHDRGRRCRTRRLSCARAMVRQPEPVLARIRATRSACASDATRSRARPPTCFSSPSTARSRAASASRRGARAHVRFAITWNYPVGAIYWFNRARPRRSRI